jgi:hypothetical protein
MFDPPFVWGDFYHAVRQALKALRLRASGRGGRGVVPPLILRVPQDEREGAWARDRGVGARLREGVFDLAEEAFVAVLDRGVEGLGEAAEEIERAIDPAPVGLERCGDLDRALAAARARARPGEIVLLSPACASFDQFRDFEERGEVFRQIVLRN